MTISALRLDFARDALRRAIANAPRTDLFRVARGEVTATNEDSLAFHVKMESLGVLGFLGQIELRHDMDGDSHHTTIEEELRDLLQKRCAVETSRHERLADIPMRNHVDPVIAWAIRHGRAEPALRAMNASRGMDGSVAMQGEPRLAIMDQHDIAQELRLFHCRMVLAHGASWRGATFSVAIETGRIVLPETLLAAAPGRPVTDIVGHPALAGLVVRSVDRSPVAMYLAVDVHHVPLADLITPSQLPPARDLKGRPLERQVH